MIFEPWFHSTAEFVSKRIVVFSTNVDLWSFDSLSILDILSSNLNNVGIRSSVLSDELGNNGELLGGVNIEIASWSIEVVVCVSVGGKITSILVTDSLESLSF